MSDGWHHVQAASGAEEDNWIHTSDLGSQWRQYMETHEHWQVARGADDVNVIDNKERKALKPADCGLLVKRDFQQFDLMQKNESTDMNKLEVEILKHPYVRPTQHPGAER